MHYVAIDLHKRYSVVSALNEQGQRAREARIDGNSAAGFAQFIHGLGGPSKVVMEATWNWGRIHDLLEKIEGVEEVVLAHPYKTRIIAEAQVKTDKLDARALAKLLRADLIARAHVPAVATRRRKEVLRQRLFWVRVQTMVRNRVHQLLDRQEKLELPQVSDLFGVRGMTALRQMQLVEPDATQLRQDLDLLGELRARVKELEAMIAADNTDDAATRLLATMPGLGKVLAAVVACEIDGVERFAHPKKLLAYAGLVPTTHASGGKSYNGPLLPQCNKWLRWAFVEAAWVAVGCSNYFGGIYRHHRARGKGANTAIVIVARRMAEIAWHLLREGRPYRDQPPAQDTLPDRSENALMEVAH
jgi:transposase